MDVDEYTLGRDYRASTRLHLQHHLWSETLNYYLNPSISNNKEDLAIADTSAKTSRTLVRHRHLWRSIPRPEWLPSNVQFVENDAFHPAGPPTDLLGTFDIVHLRLFIAIIKDDDPTPIIDYCYKLLKPGGYLQWDDLEPSANRVGSYKGSPTEGMNMISRMTEVQSGDRSTHRIARLPTDFQQRGFEIVDVDHKVILPWQRGMYADNFCMLADEFVERASRGGEGIKSVDDRYKVLPARVSAEKQLGSYFEPTLQVVVGKKL